MPRKKQTASDSAKNNAPSVQEQNEHSSSLSTTEIQDSVLKALKSSVKKALNIRQIQSRINSGISVSELETAIRGLEKDKKIEHLGGYRYKIYVENQSYEGKYELSRDGFAIVYLEELDKEVQIIESGSVRAMHGDIVRVKIVEQGRKILRGRVSEIIQRKRTEFVGTLDLESKNEPFFIPQDNRLKIEFSILDNNIGKAQHHDKVVVELVRWQTEHPVGKIIKIIGAGGEHFAEMNAIMMEFGLIDAFPPEVEHFADGISKEISADEISKRRDFRSILTLTIDPFDAKDFDDALSFQVLPNGNFEVGIHIADVTHYLKEGTVLDKEAFERATSVYLVDRTVPMLPEVLSNDLCSLVPNKDRLTYSTVFELNEEGQVLNEWFGRTVIHSVRRFSYEEVQDILDKGVGEHAQELLTLNKIAHQLRKERFAEGSINFETDEVKFQLDEKGVPIAVFKKHRKDAHKLIEDFMLLANRKVAEFVATKKGTHYIPFVYRVHPAPDYDRLRNLQKFISIFGYSLDLKTEKTISTSLNKLVSEVENTPSQNIIQTVAIRTMPKAIYTADNIGHYGLGFQYYTHFTSPIRRYPDVIAHRILDQVLHGTIPKLDLETLERQCKHSSERERNAAEAERASIRYKQVEYMEKFLDKEFEGIISGLTEWGIYVEIDEIHCEGMIPLREMKDDHYNLDETGYRLIGKYSRTVFTLGERVKIRVKKTNLVKRQIDFTMIGKKVPDQNQKKKKR